MEVPFHLKTLPPEALDILRYFRTSQMQSAHADDIIEGADLSDRGFGKAIRRLVTKNYLVMDGDQVYRLSDMGKRAVDEIGSFNENDADAQSARDDDDELTTEARFVTRHLVVVAPQTLRPDQPTNILVGFDTASGSDSVSANLELMLRLNVIHGEPAQASEKSLVLDNRAAHQTFEVTAGSYQQARLRIEVSQYQAETLDLESAGGLYIDLPVEADAVNAAPAAFGVDVTLREDVPAGKLDLDEFDFGE